MNKSKKSMSSKLREELMDQFPWRWPKPFHNQLSQLPEGFGMSVNASGWYSQGSASLDVSHNQLSQLPEGFGMSVNASEYRSQGSVH